MIRKGNFEIETAKRAVKTAQDAADCVRAAHDAKFGPAPCSADDSKAAGASNASSPAEIDAAQSKQKVEFTAQQNTQAAQNSVLMKELAEASEKLAALQPKPPCAATLQPAQPSRCRALRLPSQRRSRLCTRYTRS